MVKTISNTPLLEGLRSTGSGLGGSVWIRAMGTVSGVELACGDRLIGPVDGTLVSLDAVVVDEKIEATASIAAEVGGVPMTVSGVLVGGDAGVVHAVVIAPVSTVASRESVPSVEQPKGSGDGQSTKDAPSPASPAAVVPRAPAPAPARARVTSTPAVEPRRSAAASVGAAAAAASAPSRKSVGWGDVAAVSAKVSAGALDEDDGEVDVDELDRGDTIDHPTLEKCVVVGVLGDDAVKVRLVNGSVRKLVMRGFRLYREGDHHFRIERKT